MVRLYSVFSALFLFFYFSLAFSQCDTSRYHQPIFDSITQHLNIKYGEAKVWNIPYNKKDLFMNVYTPNNDTLSKRPLMIWVHSGGFLNGNKELEDMVALCDSFARRGYVTATIDYRKGFNPISNTSAERAVYRGTQDLRAAIRYLKEKHIDYKIDTHYTFIGGSSAGAFSVLHTVYMDQSEAPASIASGLGYPALGCLDCEGNNYSHPMNISGFVNLWGAIGDSTWINTNETAKGLHIHGKDDGTVPYGVGHPFGVPTTPKTNGSRTISNQLTSLNIPHNTYFVPGEGHEFHGTSNGDWNSPPTPYWDTIYNLIETHYTDILKKDTFSIQGNELACVGDTLTFNIAIPSNYKTCWKVTNAAIIQTNSTSVQIVCNQPGQVELSAVQFSEAAIHNGTSFFDLEVHSNPVVTFESEMDNMEVTFTSIPSGFASYHWDFGEGNTSNNSSPTHQYQSPGEYEVALTVGNEYGCKTTEEIAMDFSTLQLGSEELSRIQVYPNPANDILTILSDKNLNHLMIYNYQGQLMIEEHLLKSNKHKIEVESLSSGIYLLKLVDQQGQIYSSKITIGE